MWEGRPLVNTTLLASCCEWTTLQQGDQDHQGADILEFMNGVGQHVLCGLHYVTIKTGEQTIFVSWRNIFTYTYIVDYPT